MLSASIAVFLHVTRYLFLFSSHPLLFSCAPIDPLLPHMRSQAARPKLVLQEVPLSSLSQWFEVYGKKEPKMIVSSPSPCVLTLPFSPGKPKEDGVMLLKDMLSTFQPNHKIYGGTNHHKSFKTQSANMKSGHLTR